MNYLYCKLRLLYTIKYYLFKILGKGTETLSLRKLAVTLRWNVYSSKWLNLYPLKLGWMLEEFLLVSTLAKIAVIILFGSTSELYFKRTS